MGRANVAVVTGAAQGIGATIAVQLAQDGHPVALVDRNFEEASNVAARISASGSPAVAINANIASEDEVEAAVAEIIRSLGFPAILVNNAGFARDAFMADMATEDWDDVVAVHLRGAFLMTRAITPMMSLNGWGRVINISSISAQGHAERINYCAAKAGLHGFTKALAVELGPSGVTANVVAPGLIVTSMTEATAKRRGRNLADHLTDAVSRIPVGRAGTTADVAHAVSFLASCKAGFINGQVIYVAGGPHD
jgi:3-oxoacyl-[acyl-carrier protein] reductase